MTTHKSHITSEKETNHKGASASSPIAAAVYYLLNILLFPITLIGYVLNKVLMPDQISDWGWRVPFFIGCMIVPAIFVIRRSLQEITLLELAGLGAEPVRFAALERQLRARPERP